MQYAEALASFKPLLDYAHELNNKQQSEPRGPGPAPRAHSVPGAAGVDPQTSLPQRARHHQRAQRPRQLEARQRRGRRRVARPPSAAAATETHQPRPVPQIRPADPRRQPNRARESVLVRPAHSSPGSPLRGDAQPQRRLPHQTQPPPHRVLRRDVPAQPSAPQPKRVRRRERRTDPPLRPRRPTTTTPTTNKTPAPGATRST